MGDGAPFYSPPPYCGNVITRSIVRCYARRVVYTFGKLATL